MCYTLWIPVKIHCKWSGDWYDPTNHPSNNPFICRQSLHPSICLSIQPTIYPLDVYYEDIRYWFFVLCRSICPSVCRLVGPLLNNIKNKPNQTEPKWSELKYSRVVTGAMETLWNIEKVIIKLNLQNEKLELRKKSPKKKRENQIQWNGFPSNTHHHFTSTHSLHGEKVYHQMSRPGQEDGRWR